MKHLFIINPAAGSRDRSAQIRAAVTACCEAHGLDYAVAVSKAPGDCTRLARGLAETGAACRIYACGGDGTLNEVVAGVAGHANAAVTHLTGGSGNDFVKIFSDPARFSSIEALMNCDETEFDLIRCNGDYALNICSVGLDARIGTDVAQYKRLPLLQGFRAYALSAVVNTIRGVTEPYTVEVNGETISGPQTMICVCNGRFYGGGFNPVPDADPADGKLEVLLVHPVSRLQIAAIVSKYKNGEYRKYPDLIRHFTTDHVTIRCQKPTPINLDGEVRTASVADIRLAQEKLRFFYPKGLTYTATAAALVP